MSGYDSEDPGAYCEQIRRARVAHRCCACVDWIRAGDRYTYISGVWDGRGSSHKRCLRCSTISDHLSEMASLHGEAQPRIDLGCGHTYEDIFEEHPPDWILGVLLAPPEELQALWALQAGLRRLCQAPPSDPGGAIESFTRWLAS